MADDITDVYIATEVGNAGWQSLSALAAAQVEAKLPISSVDETVQLVSQAAQSFIVQAGEKGSLSNRLTVDKTAIRITQGIGSSSLIIYGDAEQPLNFIRFVGTGTSGFFGYQQDNQKFHIFNNSGSAPIISFDTNTGDITSLGSVNASGDIVTSSNVSVPLGEVHVGKIVGTKTDEDASVDLNTNFSVNVGGNIRFSSTASQTRFWQGDSVSVFNIYTKATQPYCWLRFANALEDGNPGFFGWENSTENFEWLKNDGVTKGLVFETQTGNLFVENDIQVDRIVGATAPDSDASIELGTNFKLKTNSNIEGYVNGTREFQILSGRVVAERQFVGGGAGGLTAANPAYAFAGALDTGFFVKTVSGKTAFGVSTNAVERLLITDTDIKAADDYEPKNPQSLATVQYVLNNAASEASLRVAAEAELQQNIDAKIWVGTPEEYLNLREILPTTLYCLTE